MPINYTLLEKLAPASAPSEASHVDSKTNDDGIYHMKVFRCFKNNNKNEQISLRLWEANL